jgi:hypothetical protein
MDGDRARSPDRDPSVPRGELKDFVELLGTETTLALVEGFGGTLIRVPKDPPHQSHVLVEALGDAGMARLIAYFGGDRLAVPLARQWRFKLYTARGMTRRAIARKLGVTEKTVYQWLREGQSADQPSLPF